MKMLAKDFEKEYFEFLTEQERKNKNVCFEFKHPNKEEYFLVEPSNKELYVYQIKEEKNGNI